MVYFSLHPRAGLKWIPNCFLQFFPHRLWSKVLPDLKEVNFKSGDGVQLKGYWLPAAKQTENRSRTVALGHGFYNNASTMIPMAQALSAKGYNVFMFDFRGHGKSSGRPVSIGFYESKDWLGVTRYLKENQPQAAKDITLLGHSMGASSLLLMPKCLEKKDVDYMVQNVNRLILDSPYGQLNLHENPFVTQTHSIPWLNPQNSVLKGLLKPIRSLMQVVGADFADAMNVYATKQLKMPTNFDGVFPAEVFKESPLVSKPVFLTHGTVDKRTPFSQAENIKQVIAANEASRVTFKPLERIDHIGNDWKPLPGRLFAKQYKSVLRGNGSEQIQYIKDVDRFIHHS